MAGAEVVDGDAYAQIAQLLQLGGCASEVGDDPAFGNFQLQAFGREGRCARASAAILELKLGRANCAPEILAKILTEGTAAAFHAIAWRHTSSMTQSPIGTISPVLSAMGMNSWGANRAPGGVLPAQQCLKARDLPVHGVDRLVGQAELTPG